MTNRIFCTLLGLAVLVAFVPSDALAAEDLKVIKGEIEALKKGQKAIQRQLGEIQRLIRSGGRATRPAPPKNVVVKVEGEFFKGDVNAPVTVVEYSDFECPFCARFFRQTLPEIEKNYIKTGKVKFVYKDYPLVRIHKKAFKAAEAAQCAGDQGKYWEMHDTIFKNKKAMAEKDLHAHAKMIGLDEVKFMACLNGGGKKAGVREDIAEAVKAGIRGTPTFLIGLTEPGKSTVKTVRRIRGAQPYPRFKAIIDQLLASKKKK
ncbi:MAG: DsbA family protein [Nitrospinaceae bacterium]|nr:DsbA family protein [Nitrospinaceae bacterium]MBT3822793.1 DsbA family protein [Nitrospinaceae bacterium]